MTECTLHTYNRAKADRGKALVHGVVGGGTKWGIYFKGIRDERKQTHGENTYDSHKFGSHMFI